jgi:hypothetical protein
MRPRDFIAGLGGAVWIGPLAAPYTPFRDQRSFLSRIASAEIDTGGWGRRSLRLTLRECEGLPTSSPVRYHCVMSRLGHWERC